MAGTPNPIDNQQVPLRPSDADPAKSYNDWLMKEQRRQSGGLSDDPTESGNPVRDARSFKVSKPKGTR